MTNAPQTPANSANTTQSNELLIGLDEAKVTIDLFLRNQFEEAKDRVTKGRPGMYQELAHSTILFVQATATLETKHIETANAYILKTLNVCSTKRRKVDLQELFKNSIKLNRRAVYKEYTEEQAHAELCHAEGLLQYAFLNFLKDSEFGSLLRSSLKIRQCYKCYRLCWAILKYRDWEDGLSKSAFESGVRLGVGAFNMMISLLPSRVLKLLKFVGFTGDRKFGLTQLQMGASMLSSLRAPLCTLLLLVYNLYGVQMLGDSVASVAFEKPDLLHETKGLLDYWQQIYVNSAIFQLLHGRYEAVKGDLEQAIETLKSHIDLPLDWAEYRHMYYWELFWCYALRADWLSAVHYVELLKRESHWSQASYRYIEAVFLIQYLDDPGRPAQQRALKEKDLANGTENERYKDPAQVYKTIEELLVEVPGLMKRFAGRALPLEKVAARKSKRYFEQNGKLTLPALEIMYIWNCFKMVHFQQDSIMTFLLLCENKINHLVQNKDKYKDYYDDYCLALLLKGVFLRCRDQLYQASMCFNEVLNLRRHIRVDKYLLPFCDMELCQLAFDKGNLVQAEEHLKQAQRYPKYSLESRLQFRIHDMKSRLRSLQQALGMENACKKVENEHHIIHNQRSGSPSGLSVQSITALSKEHTATDSGSDLDSIASAQMFSEFDDDIEMVCGFSSDEDTDIQ